MSHVLFYSSMGKVVANVLFLICFMILGNSYNKEFFPVGHLTSKTHSLVLSYSALSVIVYLSLSIVAVLVAIWYYNIPVIRTVSLDMKQNFWLFYGTSLGKNPP